MRLLPGGGGALVTIASKLPSDSDFSKALAAMPETRGLAPAGHRTLVCGVLAHRDTLLGRLHALFARVEPASHVLFWARGLGLSAAGGGACQRYVLEEVELAQLRLTFAVRFLLDERSGAPARVVLQSSEYGDYELATADELRPRAGQPQPPLERLGYGR